MLSVLFGKETRIKILNFFLIRSEQKNSASQISHEIGLSTAIIRRELITFTKLGLLRKEAAAKSSPDQNLYYLEKSFILYPELKALFTKAQILVSQKFINNLQKICQPKFLALSGLFVNNSQSPTDILVVARVRRLEFLKLIKELEDDLKKEVNFTLMDEKEFIYRKEIMDVFLYNILEDDNIILIDQISKK